MDLSLLPYRPERDVYRLLGVPPSASIEEISAACRRLTRAFHPDRNVSPRATQEMQVVNVVRRVMTDPRMRAEYDIARQRWLAAASEPIQPLVAPWPPIEIDRTSRRSRSRAYARAAWLGMRTTFGALVPPRCRVCRVVLTDPDEEDAYCASCGARLVAASS
jgi:curved DNA-binding protein CbpA